MIVDLFSGPRGWSVGRQALGLRDVGLELDAAACRTATAAGHATVQCDVAQYPTAPFADRITGFIASPPCQAWTRAGKGLGLIDQPLVQQAVEDLAHGRDTRAELKAGCRDERSILAAEPMRWLHDLRPEWICMEEVPAVLPLWHQYAQHLQAWGYSAWVGVLNAADYGVPQTRKRAILIASRTQPAAAPEPTHTQNPSWDLFGESLPGWISMADALDLEPDVRVITRGNRKTSGGNAFSADGPSWALTEKARSWVLHSRRDSPKWVALHGPRRNRSGDQPAPSITGEAHRWYWTEDGEWRRRLEVSEAAVLQGFPADYPWQGARTRQFLQIGNAVPPLLAAHVVSAATGIPMPASQHRQAAA